MFNELGKIGNIVFKVIVIFIIANIVFLMCKVETRPNEYSAVKQFGKIIRVEKTEDTAYGLSFKIPFIQSVTKIERDLMLYDLAPSEVMTSDKKTMISDCFATWQIIDAKLFIQKLSGSRDTAEYRINTTIYNSMKNVISSLPQEEVISGRNGELATMILAGIGNNLSGYGIEVTAIETKMLDLPDENKAAVYDRMISERNNIAATYVAQGEKEATEIKNATTEKVTILLSEAQKNADWLTAQGDAEYMKLMSSAYNDESKANFYIFVRQLDAMKASFKNSGGTIVLDKTSPIAQLFYNVNY
ncbi:MAG TPA: protease modulator HflC [Lachnospiraceae bacterium]|nr:protease modulator HflC [Lachnospiraceae bacterium]